MELTTLKETMYVIGSLWINMGFSAGLMYVILTGHISSKMRHASSPNRRSVRCVFQSCIP
jgi:hypothetical protein